VVPSLRPTIVPRGYGDGELLSLCTGRARDHTKLAQHLSECAAMARCCGCCGVRGRGLAEGARQENRGHPALRRLEMEFSSMGEWPDQGQEEGGDGERADPSPLLLTPVWSLDVVRRTPPNAVCIAWQHSSAARTFGALW
jgi:hypothetical protein